MFLARMLLALLGAYLTVGLLFGVVFEARGARRIDPAAQEAGWGFKLLTLPAAATLWPLLALRWARSRSGRAAPPAESSPHRTAARARQGSEVR